MADNRVNNNNSNAEAQRANRNADRNRAAPVKPTEKSPFQKIMDQKLVSNHDSSSQGQGPSSHSNTETREAVRGVTSQQERYGREKESFQKRFEEKESKTDDSKGGSSKDNSTSRAKDAEKKVIGRSSTSERQHQGEGGGSFGEGKSGSGKRGKMSDLKAADRKEGKLEQAGELDPTALGGFNYELKQAQTASEVAKKSVGFLNKALLDQLVQYCRLTTKTDGDKEMEMQLHESVFKGLKLKVSTKDGQVEATFITHSREVMSLFQAQKSALHQALQEKGVDVKRINIIMV